MDSQNDVSPLEWIVCGVRSLYAHKKDGAVWVHGPVSRCPGLGKHLRSTPPPSTTLQLPQVHQH